MKIAFLVYDSRSGSTLLSREISERFKDVYVTPEIGFDKLLNIGERGLAKLGWAAVLRALYQGHEFTNFDLPYETALKMVMTRDGALGLVEGIKTLVAEFARCHNRADAKVVIVKNGSHTRHWKIMHKLFGDELSFIHIIRDPRAVINSKLRTIRPYHPEESMAWGGCLPAAIRWKSYVNGIDRARAKGVRTHEMRYEDLVTNVSGSLKFLEMFLGLPQGGSESSYEIPKSEQNIHKLVLAKGIVNARAEAWLTELTIWDRYRIETLCGTEMERLGYGDISKAGYLKKIVVCIFELPGIVLKITRHALLQLKQPQVRVKNSDND